MEKLIRSLLGKRRIWALLGVLAGQARADQLHDFLAAFISLFT